MLQLYAGRAPSLPDDMFDPWDIVALAVAGSLEGPTEDARLICAAAAAAPLPLLQLLLDRPHDAGTALPKVLAAALHAAALQRRWPACRLLADAGADLAEPAAVAAVALWDAAEPKGYAASLLPRKA